MSTRTTGKRETLDLIGRMQKRDHEGKPVIGGSRRYYTRQDHIRAEYDGLARRVRKMSSQYNKKIACTRDYNQALNDVLAIVRELKR